MSMGTGTNGSERANWRNLIALIDNLAETPDFPSDHVVLKNSINPYSFLQYGMNI